MFQQLLREESIGLHLEAPNREAALAELLALLPRGGLTARQKAEVLELLIQRERFGTTATGDGLAVPHCIYSGTETPLASLGISRRGIAYPSLDGAPVYIVMLMIFPERSGFDAERHRILKDVEVLFRDRFLRERLKISENPDEAFEIILREATHLADNFRIVAGH